MDKLSMEIMQLLGEYDAPLDRDHENNRQHMDCTQLVMFDSSQSALKPQTDSKTKIQLNNIETLVL